VPAGEEDGLVRRKLHNTRPSRDAGGVIEAIRGGGRENWAYAGHIATSREEARRSFMERKKTSGLSSNAIKLSPKIQWGQKMREKLIKKTLIQHRQARGNRKNGEMGHEATREER